MKLWGKYKGLVYLALLVVGVPLLAYGYALGSTVAKWQKARSNCRRIEHLRNEVDRTTSSSAVDVEGTEMMQSGLLMEELLPHIEEGGVRIEHFSPCVTSEQDGIRLSTAQLTLQGGFAGIVRVLAETESGFPQCKVISAQFRSARPRNRKSSKTLSCTVYIQQITAND